MTHTENQQRLHNEALAALDSIQNCRKMIKQCQDNMVNIDKNPVLTRSVKNVLLDSYESNLAKLRETKDGWVEHYATLMQQLCDSYLPKVTDLELLNN